MTNSPLYKDDIFLFCGNLMFVCCLLLMFVKFPLDDGNYLLSNLAYTPKGHCLSNYK